MITLHVLADNASPAVLERALLYLKRTKQRTVNIGAGAELLKGMQYVDRVRVECPGIKVFWRNMEPEDTGIHTKMSAQSLFDKKVAPYLDWFKKNEIILVCDNESSGDDNAIRKYTQWTVDLLVTMHKHNLATGVCRFATGNIDDGSQVSNQYLLLKPIFSAMLPSDWITPNEYSNAPGKSSGGHLARYKLMWAVAGKPLPTFIGEAGLCPDYDPGKGFRSVNMSGKAYADQMIAEEVWYPGVDRALFVAGGFGWENFQLIKEIGNGKVEADTLDELEAHYAKQPPVVIQPPPPPPVPPEPTLPVDLGNPITVRVSGDNWLLRAAPTINATQIGRLIIGEEVLLYPFTATSADGESFKVVERVIPVISEARRGWTAMPTPVYVPPPLPAETIELIARLAIMTAKLHGLASLIESVVSELHQLQDDLATKKVA